MLYQRDAPRTGGAGRHISGHAYTPLNQLFTPLPPSQRLPLPLRLQLGEPLGLRKAHRQFRLLDRLAHVRLELLPLADFDALDRHHDRLVIVLLDCIRRVFEELGRKSRTESAPSDFAVFCIVANSCVLSRYSLLDLCGRLISFALSTQHGKNALRKLPIRHHMRIPLHFIPALQRIQEIHTLAPRDERVQLRSDLLQRARSELVGRVDGSASDGEFEGVAVGHPGGGFEERGVEGKGLRCA